MTWGKVDESIKHSLLCRDWIEVLSRISAIRMQEADGICDDIRNDTANS
jgi:hypothetical protein